MTVWNTIDDKFSIIPLYRNEATFLDLASFESIFSMTVLNTIDAIYSIFHYIETKPHFLLLSLFQSLFSTTVWNTIDDRYFNCFLLYRAEAYVTNFCPFSEHFQYDSVEYNRSS